MKQRTILALVSIGIGIGIGIAIGLAPAASAQEVEETNLFLILLSEEGPADVDAAVQAAGGTLQHKMLDIGYVSAYSEDPDFALNMGLTEGVEAVDPDLGIQWLPGTDVPETTSSGGEAVSEFGRVADPNTAIYKSCQWNLDQIQTPFAWAQGEFGDGVTVAVLDTGVSGDPAFGGGDAHQDLLGQIVGNVTMVSEENPFCVSRGAADTLSPLDYRFHGTFVAGQIAAHGIGIAGVAPDAKIYGVKVLSCAGIGSFSDIVAGIIHAANEPSVDVINMSLGAYIPRNLAGAGPLMAGINKAVNYAQGAMGKLVVSSAGNNGADLTHDGNLIVLPGEAGSGVAAWSGDFFGGLASYSNHGQSGAQVGAGGGDFTPGVLIPDCPLPAFAHDAIVSVCSVDSVFVDCESDFYAYNGSGTSFSAPLVSGVAALAKGKFPTLNGNQLKTRLYQTADDLGDMGVDNLFSQGRVNANTIVTVPEPTAGLLLLFGVVGLAGLAAIRGSC